MLAHLQKTKIIARNTAISQKNMTFEKLNCQFLKPRLTIKRPSTYNNDNYFLSISMKITGKEHNFFSLLDSFHLLRGITKLLNSLDESSNS